MKKNNKGSSLVMVVIIVALIGILVSVILSSSMLNYQMKAINVNSKNNFYTAEAALDEIKAGLEKEISTAFSKAYIEVMQQYHNTSESDREANFKEIYSKNLCETLEKTNPGVDSTKYSLELLKSYLKETSYSEDTKIGAKITSSNESLVVGTKGVILRDLCVTYIDEKDYMTKITTDLVLQYPDINFTQSTTIPNILQYCLIANDSLVANGSMTSFIKGNAYAGRNGMIANIANLTFQAGSTVISKGAVKVQEGATVTVASKSNIWAQDLEVTSANLNLNGTTYVANDLTIRTQGNFSNNITISNEYYGFGNEEAAKEAQSLSDKEQEIKDNPADYSSSILVNGKNVTIDLSKVKKMLLGGNSYIGETKAFMGESLTVKSNQIAYLVPGECIGRGTKYSGINPTTKEYYDGLYTLYKDDVSKMVDFKYPIVKYDNKTLEALGVNSVERYVASNGQAYFYMLFESAKKASDFYQTYYSSEADSAESKKLNEYLGFYVDLIKASNNSQIKYTLNGNVITYDKTTNKGSYLSDTLDSGNQDYIKEQEIGFQDAYAAYCTKLINSYHSLSQEEKNLDVFENIVKQSEIDESVIGSNCEMKFVNESDEVVALVVNKQGTENSTLRISRISEEITQERNKIHVIITTGNVIVDQNFDGLIIAKGKITIEDNVTITKNQEEVQFALQAKNEKDQMLAHYLKDAEGYLNASTSDSGNDEIVTTAIDLAGLIAYENWSKE